MGTALLLRTGSREGGPGETPGERGDPGSKATEEHVLSCARCHAAVTTTAERIAIGGAHEHTRANPGGWVHRFGCFARAPGCRAVGAPTGEFSWFPGTSWQIAVCASCRDHLGWRFAGEEVFWGLLLAKLVES